MVANMQENMLDSLKSIYQRYRGRRHYMPVMEVVQHFQELSGTQSADAIRQAIYQTRQRYPDVVKIDKQRGINDFVVRITDKGLA